MSNLHRANCETAFILAKSIEVLRNLIPNEKDELEYSQFEPTDSFINERFPDIFFTNFTEDVWGIISDKDKFARMLKRYFSSFNTTQACEIIFEQFRAQTGGDWSGSYDRLKQITDYLEYLMGEFNYAYTSYGTDICVVTQDYKPSIAILRKLTKTIENLLEENGFGNFIPKQKAC